MLIKYIKSVLWREAKRLSYIEDAGCLKFKHLFESVLFYYCFERKYVKIYMVLYHKDGINLSLKQFNSQFGF